MDTVLGAGIPISIRSAELFGTFIENQRKKRVDTITSKRIVAVTPREGRRMERRLTWLGHVGTIVFGMDFNESSFAPQLLCELDAGSGMDRSRNSG
jgi:hypothetical protein